MSQKGKYILLKTVGEVSNLPVKQHFLLCRPDQFYFLANQGNNDTGLTNKYFFTIYFSPDMVFF